MSPRRGEKYRSSAQHPHPPPPPPSTSSHAARVCVPRALSAPARRGTLLPAERYFSSNQRLTKAVKYKRRWVKLEDRSWPQIARILPGSLPADLFLWKAKLTLSRQGTKKGCQCKFLTFCIVNSLDFKRQSSTEFGERHLEIYCLGFPSIGERLDKLLYKSINDNASVFSEQMDFKQTSSLDNH